ncbi:MAG: taurine dioxygenase, partial [Gammaproteobacteria bacterium]
MNIEPLSNALGAEIAGVDWSEPLDQSIVEQTKAALLHHHLVCLRSDRLSAAEYADLASHFGEPQLQLLRDARDPAVPVVSVFDSTYKDAKAKPANLQLDRRSGWHTDDSYFAIPAKITLLQAITIPSVGGETRFCNAAAAYEDLDAADKKAFVPLRAVHSYDTSRAPARAVARKPEEQADTTDVTHPLIRTNDESGTKAIYFNSNRTDRIVGLPRNESDALLDRIHAHMTQKKYQYHHRWHLNDILMWDNRNVTHSVNMDFPVGETRIHQRVLLR